MPYLHSRVTGAQWEVMPCSELPIWWKEVLVPNTCSWLKQAGKPDGKALRPIRKMSPHSHVTFFFSCRGVPYRTLQRSWVLFWMFPHRSFFPWIIESLRLQKTSDIKSSHQPNTTMPTKPCPEVPHLHVFWTPPGMVTQSLPWAAYSNVYSNVWPLFQ